MEKTESNLETDLPYLKDVLELSVLQKGRANIIVAPCASGKTTAACEIMQKHATSPRNVLYLIDTTAGKDALIARKAAQRCTMAWIHQYDPFWWGGEPDTSKCAVMTYHQFGLTVKDTPAFLMDVELIICDEMHNLIKYIGIEKRTNEQKQKAGDPEQQDCCQRAFDTLSALAARTGRTPMIVILTATVKPLAARFELTATPYICLDYYGKVRSCQTKQRIFYTDLVEAVCDLKGRAVIFVPNIDQMKRFADIADIGGKKICCLWSVHSTKEMTKQQLEVRSALLTGERIPKEIDLLFINAAYETSINIRNTDFRTMVIHDSNPETQIQVRGRLRHDIDTLYLYDKQHEHIASYFPEDCLDKWIPSAEMSRIADEISLRSPKGRALKWPSIRKLLEHDGYLVHSEKQNGQRGWRIHKLSA